MKRVGGLFLYAILAGFCIGLGGTVFLKLKDAFPGGNVVGAGDMPCLRERRATYLTIRCLPICWICWSFGWETSWGPC